MVFINNLALLHARDPYVDPEQGPGRHLVRLWLRNPALAWDIPPAMRVPWEAAFGPDGHGFPGLQRKNIRRCPRGSTSRQNTRPVRRLSSSMTAAT